MSAPSMPRRRAMSLVEYGLIAVLVVLIAIPAVRAFGGSVTGTFSSVTSAMGTDAAVAPTFAPSPSPTATPPPVINLATVARCAAPSALDVYYPSTTGDVPFDVDHLIDGNDVTEVVSNTTMDSTPGQPWFQVSFTTPTEIEAFRVIQTSGDAGNAEAFTVTSSDDLSSWTTRYSWAGSVADTGLLPLTGGAVSATYWRITADPGADGNGWQVGSFELHGPSVPGCSGSNLALSASGASAAAVSTYDPGGNPYAPANIIDSNDATQAVTIDPIENDWYLVDLGSPQSISFFRVLQTTSYRDRASRYTIESADSSGGPWTVRHTFAGNGAPSESGTVPLPSGPITARYWLLRAGNNVPGNHGWIVHSFELLTP